ncbi:energy transducer TonB [Pelagicoccus sp. SDUM812005]|uniref:energy transducer TonB n=1 Tax=Pelagicoccus sp. SDUM812005 TaxID=3041257 RepID=UPI00280C8C44|nr:energy transducer TonB [Pelagicoccus sp. SDUM812005]MDQ8180054.1 energy transducer TonB [Pelagicoccus sp. SDUM812005]
METHRRAIESRKTLEPLVIVSIAPPYPENLRKKKITGEAVIETVVTYEGVPTKLKLVTATHEEFGKSALLAVGKMRFLPALNEGEPVNSLIRVPVTFDP